jgi:hypothetical protein
MKVDFQGSRVTSDSGSVLVREFDERTFHYHRNRNLRSRASNLEPNHRNLLSNGRCAQVPNRRPDSLQLAAGRRFLKFRPDFLPGRHLSRPQVVGAGPSSARLRPAKDRGHSEPNLPLERAQKPNRHLDRQVFLMFPLQASQ